MNAVLISADELREAPGENLRLLDVRWQLGDPEGPQHYQNGHIPGAVFVDLDTELAALPSPAHGRHPLPDPAQLQKCARSWGLCAGDPVVVYDELGGMSAARAWWLLRWAGIADVRILDGGLPAWLRCGGELATGVEPDPVPGDIELDPGRLPVIDADAAARWRGVLLDARAAERYRGDLEPIDPRAGHIPGAISLPTSENLGEDGCFLPAELLRERFGGLGAEPVAVYCGSGVTAAHAIAALAVAGVPAALYPGSWSQWAHDPKRPVATGV
ncbi:sulfurtransferase [Nocardia sp. NPDC024068]|uniref:sulfurtransferase n=1 Tax=Nocardia sp. NPDC024068 TaxID=3157197 RepID=UPI0034015B67